MPYALGAINVQAGQSYTVPVGAAGTVGAVVCANESPYAVNASISPTGFPGQWIVAQTADLIACDVTGFNGTLTFTTDNYLSNAASAPSFLLYLTAYAPGEAIRGTYPAPLVRLANGSIGVATQLVNDGNSVGSNIIESTPAGAVNSYILVRNDGTFQVWSISNNVLTEIINVTPGASASPASLVLKLLEVIGAVKLDSGKIVSDGAGNLIVGTVTGSSSVATGSLAINATNGGSGGLGVPGWTLGFNADDALYQIGGFSGAGAYGSHRFVIVDNGSQVSPFGVGQSFNVTPLAWIDGAGVLHATAPVTLAAGNQETGYIAMGAQDAGGGFNHYAPANFKTVLTNTPTSISFSVISSTNATAPTALSLSKYGFMASNQSSAAGASSWAGTYTTAGNCLLALDSTAGTFDHHCGACGHVSLAVSTSHVYTLHVGSLVGLSYTCPACGVTESFNAGLTEADAADPSPQGSGQYATTRGAQATLIRQLMTAVGLTVAANPATGATGTPGVTPNAKP